MVRFTLKKLAVQANSKQQIHQSSMVECVSRRRPLDEANYSGGEKRSATDCRPLNIVEDAGLRDVLCLATAKPSYTLPSWGTIGKLHMLAQ
ncbi:hypothetical protein JOB18_048290 [Solea senegalensis]|uniref:Uncharacterized protein n=1 Tax=Solea senegalensis TaxID=28829 RepID=A0AAV6SY64_SOLSE|nr:hypothetical protein JOB18_048290 [Solea senegalensis]